jgi:hypothetical protein
VPEGVFFPMTGIAYEEYKKLTGISFEEYEALFKAAGLTPLTMKGKAKLKPVKRARAVKAQNRSHGGTTCLGINYAMGLLPEDAACCTECLDGDHRLKWYPLPYDIELPDGSRAQEAKLCCAHYKLLEAAEYAGGWIEARRGMTADVDAPRGLGAKIMAPLNTYTSMTDEGVPQSVMMESVSWRTQWIKDNFSHASAWMGHKHPYPINEGLLPTMTWSDLLQSGTKMVTVQHASEPKDHCSFTGCRNPQCGACGKLSDLYWSWSVQAWLPIPLYAYYDYALGGLSASPSMSPLGANYTPESFSSGKQCWVPEYQLWSVGLWSGYWVNPVHTAVVKPDTPGASPHLVHYSKDDVFSPGGQYIFQHVPTSSVHIPGKKAGQWVSL